MSKEEIFITTPKESLVEIIQSIPYRLCVLSINPLALLLKNSHAVGYISRCAKHVAEMSQWYNTVNTPAWSHQSIIY